MTRRTPKSELRGLEYSAKEKWNLDRSQFRQDQDGLVPGVGLGPFPNQLGLGSDTYNLELGTMRMFGAMMFLSP